MKIVHNHISFCEYFSQTFFPIKKAKTLMIAKDFGFLILFGMFSEWEAPFRGTSHYAFSL